MTEHPLAEGEGRTLTLLPKGPVILYRPEGSELYVYTWPAREYNVLNGVTLTPKQAQDLINDYANLEESE